MRRYIFPDLPDRPVVLIPFVLDVLVCRILHEFVWPGADRRLRPDIQRTLHQLVVIRLVDRLEDVLRITLVHG